MVCMIKVKYFQLKKIDYSLKKNSKYIQKIINLANKNKSKLHLYCIRGLATYRTNK